MLKEEKCPYCSASLEYDENNFSGEVECKYCHTKIMVIREGEFIRTKDGVIAKVTATGYGLDCDKDVFDLECLQMMEIPPEHVQEYVIKHSFNIIDLIEVGDYVNGDKIVKIEKDIYIGGLNLWAERDAPDGFGGFYRVKYRENDIKSVVTHEQMEAMEYEVK